MAFLKAIGPPGSPGFLLAVIAASLFVGFIWPRRRKLAGAGLLTVLTGYLLLACPLVVRTLVEALPAPSAAVAPAAPALDALLVFDGDNRRGRVHLAEALLAAAPNAQVIVLGSTLILADMPPELIARLHHLPAANTRDQMAAVRQFSAAHPDHRAAIIVSRLQAPRVARLAARAGLRTAILPAALDAELPGSQWSGPAPNLSALAVGRDALYEHLALWYYGWRGWI